LPQGIPAVVTDSEAKTGYDPPVSQPQTAARTQRLSRSDVLYVRSGIGCAHCAGAQPGQRRCYGQYGPCESNELALLCAGRAQPARVSGGVRNRQ
jgi:hypothetical protein